MSRSAPMFGLFAFALAACSADERAPTAPPAPSRLEIAVDVDAGELPVARSPPPVPEEAQHALVGKRAPMIAGYALDGRGMRDVALEPSTHTVVHFWATWCNPCKRSIAKLVELVNRNKAVRVVTVSVDDEPDGVGQFIKEVGAAVLTNVWDREKRLADAFKVPTMPCTYVIDASGVVRTVQTGYHDGDIEALERGIETTSDGSNRRSPP